MSPKRLASGVPFKKHNIIPEIVNKNMGSCHHPRKFKSCSLLVKSAVAYIIKKMEIIIKIAFSLALYLIAME